MELKTKKKLQKLIIEALKEAQTELEQEKKEHDQRRTS